MKGVKRQKSMPPCYENVLKLVLLYSDIIHARDDLGALVWFRIINRSINNYILDTLLIPCIKSTQIVYVAGVSAESIIQRSYIPRPIMFLHHPLILVSTIVMIKEGPPATTVFFTVFSRYDEVIIRIIMHSKNNFIPDESVLATSHIMVLTQYRQNRRHVLIYGRGFDMNRDACQTCMRFKNACLCGNSTSKHIIQSIKVPD